MASSSMTNKKTGLIFVLVTMLIWTGAAAQSDCSNVLMSMAACLNYVTGSSGSPSSSCCSSLASVVQSQPQCLCTALSSGAGSMFGITIDRQKALALPGACNVKTPPVSLCDAVKGPVAAPQTISPAAAASDSPTSSPVSGGN